MANGNGNENEEEGVLWDSEHEEHRPPYPFKSETELVSQSKKAATDGRVSRLDSSDWEEHCLPNRYARSAEPNIKGHHRVDDCSFSSSLLDDNSSQHSQQSQQMLPESLMQVISSPSMYLDSSDRNMLQQYRQQNLNKKKRSGSEILGRKSDAEDSNPGSPHNIMSNQREDVLDDDLQRIESQLI